MARKMHIYGANLGKGKKSKHKIVHKAKKIHKVKKGQGVSMTWQQAMQSAGLAE